MRAEKNKHAVCTIYLFIICLENLNCYQCSICALFKLIQSFFSLSISYYAFLRWIASPNMILHSPLHLKSNFEKHDKKNMQCQTNRLRYLSRAYILQTIKILEKKCRLNYELQQIFVVATLEKQTMSKEVKKLNNDFQRLFIVVRER